MANHYLAEGIHKIKYKHWYDNKKCETGIKYKDSEDCLEYRSIKDYMREYFNKNYQNSVMKI